MAASCPFPGSDALLASVTSSIGNPWSRAVSMMASKASVRCRRSTRAEATSSVAARIRSSSCLVFSFHWLQVRILKVNRTSLSHHEGQPETGVGFPVPAVLRRWLPRRMAP